MQEEVAKVGLRVNNTKCEVFGHCPHNLRHCFSGATFLDRRASSSSDLPLAPTSSAPTTCFEGSRASRRPWRSSQLSTTHSVSSPCCGAAWGSPSWPSLFALLCPSRSVPPSMPSTASSTRQPSSGSLCLSTACNKPSGTFHLAVVARVCSQRLTPSTRLTSAVSLTPSAFLSASSA